MSQMKNLISLYQQVRANQAKVLIDCQSFPPDLAIYAMRVARTLLRWEQLEWDEHSDTGYVRLRAEADESCFDMFGDEEAYVNQYGRRVSAEEAKKETERIIERNGVWYVSSQYRLTEESEWINAGGLWWDRPERQRQPARLA